MRYSLATLLGTMALAGFVFMGWRVSIYLGLLHFWLACVISGAWAFHVYRRVMLPSYARDETMVTGAGAGGAMGFFAIVLWNFFWEERTRIHNTVDVLFALPAACLFAIFPSVLGALVGSSLAYVIAPTVKRLYGGVRRAKLKRLRRIRASRQVTAERAQGIA